MSCGLLPPPPPLLPGPTPPPPPAPLERPSRPQDSADQPAIDLLSRDAHALFRLDTGFVVNLSGGWGAGWPLHSRSLATDVIMLLTWHSASVQKCGRQRCMLRAPLLTGALLPFRPTALQGERKTRQAWCFGCRSVALRSGRFYPVSTVTGGNGKIFNWTSGSKRMVASHSDVPVL